MMKLLGAVLIIVGCGGIGFSMCHTHRRLEQALEQLMRSLDWMVWELNCRMPPLNALCRGAAQVSKGSVRRVLDKLAQELDAQVTPDASSCMTAALAKVPNLPPQLTEHFQNLGTSLGHFDLQGQIAALESASMLCRRDLDELGRNRQLRLRNYQTLGICTGVALVILFL